MSVILIVKAARATTMKICKSFNDLKHYLLSQLCKYCFAVCFAVFFFNLSKT